MGELRGLRIGGGVGRGDGGELGMVEGLGEGGDLVVAGLEHLCWVEEGLAELPLLILGAERKLRKGVLEHGK